LNKTTYDLEITFTTPVLGTQPQKDVAVEYITSKAINPETGELPEDEVGTLPEELEKGTTAFHRLDDRPIYYDYMVKGFFKEVGNFFNGKLGVKNLRSKIENACFVLPRQIVLNIPDGKGIDFLSRPLRAQTAQGPRTSLARSEKLPEGTSFKCQLLVFEGEVTENILREILDYGMLKGLGQWRNGGHGRFTYTLTKAE